MKRRYVLMGGVAAMTLGACSTKFRSYDGPEVTYVVVNKGARKMYLMHHDKVLKDYVVDLGFEPLGHKTVQGDGKTPEGDYFIDRRNPNSKFHLSLGISYPDADDLARARAAGEDPGGDIFIHGESKKLTLGKNDWTWGCIAVTNRQMEDIYAMVRTGTPIRINP